jgi:hypothetical protein
MSITSPTSVDEYTSRRSSRVAADRYVADEDNWVEALAVCESATAPTVEKKKSSAGGLFRKFKSSTSSSSSSAQNTVKDDTIIGPRTGGDDDDDDDDDDIAAASQRLTIRPYFQSQRTGQRVWDEPPSGASTIVYATPEARRMAHAQLEEMRSSFAREALIRRQERAERDKSVASSLGQRRQQQSLLFRNADGGLVGRLSKSLPIPKAFRLSTSSTSATENDVDVNQSSSSLLGNDSHFTTTRSSRGRDRRLSDSVPKSILDESKELAGISRKEAYEADLQAAMLMSMGIGGGSVMGVGDHTHGNRSSSKSSHNSNTSPTANNRSGLTRAEEEQLAMAMALSLSEQPVDFDYDFDSGGKKMPPK